MTTPPDFLAGTVLEAAQLNQIGFWLVKTQTIGTTVSSITVTDAFSANYENYRIVIYGGVGSTAQNINLVLGASNTGYYFSGIEVLYASNTISYTRSNNGTSWVGVGLSTTTANALDITLFSPFATAKTGIAQNSRIDARTTGAGGQGGSGFHDVAASYTDFTISGSGTFTGGIIYVYGLRD